MNNVCNDVRQQFVFFKMIKQQAKVKIYLYTTVCGQSKEYEWLTKTSLNKLALLFVFKKMYGLSVVFTC